MAAALAAGSALGQPHREGAGRPARSTPSWRRVSSSSAGWWPSTCARPTPPRGCAPSPRSASPVFHAGGSGPWTSRSRPSRTSWSARSGVRPQGAGAALGPTGTGPASSPGRPGGGWGSWGCWACASPRLTAARSGLPHLRASPWRRSGAATSAAPTASSSRAWRARSSGASGTEEIKDALAAPDRARRGGGRARPHRARRRLGRGQSRLPGRARRRRLRDHRARSPGSASAWWRRPRSSSRAPIRRAGRAG